MKTENEIRKEYNAYVLQLFREGKTLTAIIPEATFFPPRPIIKKDKEAVEKLYNKSLTII